MEKAKTLEQAAVAMAMKRDDGFNAEAPFLKVDAVNWRQGANGPYVAWQDGFEHNVVVNQGKGKLLNDVFGSATASTAGAFIFLHSAGTGSNSVWANISASQVHSYGANMPVVTFASTHTDGLGTAYTSYNFTASTQTVSGCGLVFYTSASNCSTSITAGAAALYAYGTFTAGSRQVQSGDSLSVTLTVSFA